MSSPDLPNSVPRSHQVSLGKVVSELRCLQSHLLEPSEYKLFCCPLPGMYTVQMFDYPLGLTVHHLQRALDIPCVVDAWIDLSLRGTNTESRGALCVKVDMRKETPGSKRKVDRDEEPQSDSDHEDDDEETITMRHRRRRPWTDERKKSWFGHFFSPTK